ncbi:KGGVGR-motif variant AAA ATPase [Dolichospermum sp. UHCC 0259]|uniref:tyrosine-protein kinase family protein n=1 Tax=Dolichospermum sp. UHCC 0259 TaxID=2590010 RepID=UPI0014482AD2|nr:AAA family ATPase [Dolichospermum sp. UHCC 0259]MTJ50731.1 tyrosine-protein kinase family protein [Dolichospermum sp. UHCC 0259]
MISFSETFDKVQECFNENIIVDTLIPKLKSVTIIRDVNGKIRIFLEPKPSETTNIEESETTDLNNFLSTKLGKYYGNDIWLPKRDKDAYKALIKSIEAERVFASWDHGDDESVLPRWYILERHIAKQAWTDNQVSTPPWPETVVYQKYKPAIISFFSFKGGVGRTSSLVATALTLARNGHRVAIVDLDLEAPGLATIFSPDNSNNPGVIDYLLEKKIQEQDWKLRTHLISINERILLDDNGESIQLLPAGTVDKNYLEKLARLDFQNLVNGELESTMVSMLKELESAVRPLDFILMDARAGFHDIGGLAIAKLSHAAVIFGTQSRQSWAGLTHVIRHLASPGVDERLPLVLVHSMAPAIGILGRDIELREFREKAYDLFQENYYSVDETVPDSNDREAPFFPLVVPYQESLRGDIALFLRNSTSEEFTRLSNLVEIMTDSSYKEIAEKLCNLFGREFQKNN